MTRVKPLWIAALVTPLFFADGSRIAFANSQNVRVPSLLHPALSTKGKVRDARPVRQSLPRFPEAARKARVSGVVKLFATIGKDGSVQRLRVISGHPLLVTPAVEAVRGWKYRPALLNDEPVEVFVAIELTFLVNRPRAFLSSAR